MSNLGFALTVRPVATCLVVGVMVGLVVTACGGDALEAATVDRRSSAIVRGTPAEEQLPTLAAIVLWERNAEEQVLAVICSGTLIAPDVVLTAGHCIERHGPKRAPAGAERAWFVSFQTDLRGLGEQSFALPADAVEVRDTRIHPGFSPAENNRVGLGPSHDLGLVFLTDPVLDRAPSPLMSAEAAGLLQAGQAVLIAGYGSRSADGRGTRPADAPGLKSYGVGQVLEVGSHELRVGRPAQPRSDDEQSLADKCEGDSGGPTFLGQGDQLLLAGVSSRGYDTTESCESAAVDLRVDRFLPWIREQLGDSGAAVSSESPPGCTMAGPGQSGAAAWLTVWLLLAWVLGRSPPHKTNSTGCSGP